MEKQDVIEFFDRCAQDWDAGLIKSDAIINRILDNAQVAAGQDVLDVACGTGVMIPYYLQRQVNSVTAIDISPRMAELAQEKFANDSRVEVLCGDVEEQVFRRKFDVIVVYNAFPHFPEPRRLIATLSDLLKPGGRLTVAHGMSREAIDGHHGGSASKVSVGLMRAESLKRLFEAQLQVEVMISSNQMYQVVGVRNGRQAVRQDSTLDELLALMRFTVDHNDAHAQELAELGSRLQESGNRAAWRQVMDAVSDFDMVNAKLDAVIESISEKDA